MQDPFRLDDRVVLITGGSSGLGRATARHVAAAGGIVVATGRNEERLLETMSSLPGEGHRHVVADLTTDEGRATVIATAGVIDGLVLAAGVAQVAPLRYTRDKVIDRVFGINVEARLAMCQQLAAQRCLRDGASLVFISSLSVVQGVKGHVAYAASMAACEGASRAIAAELAQRQIRCNVLAPGLVRTPLLEAGDITAESMEAMSMDYPMGLGKPGDVSAALVYLLSPASRWLTGQTLKLEGGYTLDC